MGPLVSVGIPTYNRPQGVKRTLECITNQTYKNIEIIVSSNNPLPDETDKIVNEYKITDKRIKYFKQSNNIGAVKNFGLVLEQATGKYFMWAADDDIRTLDCIEYYMNNISNAGAIFSNYAVIDLTNTDNIIVGDEIPKMQGDDNKEDLKRFVEKLCPSMLYGLFDRANLTSIFNVELGFDWSDCFLLIKYISMFGYKTVIDNTPRYFAGIEGKNYSAKPTKGKYLNPWKYFRKSLPYIIPLGYKYANRHYNMCKQAWNNRHHIEKKNNGITLIDGFFLKK